ncbi:MAG: suppressor of fused domain protein, partial [Acidimicrobiaceae bacterium]|nr:suppressor of fused domain protein [Acidimicrobiaceae bacterium]
AGPRLGIAVSRGRGTRAIDAHVDHADGGPPEHRYRPKAPHRFRGEGPLDEVTAHRIEARPGGGPDHWHLVTYGLTELTLKESDDPLVSGWGFELTFRLGGADEPLWAVDLLANLAAYVWTTEHPFAEGHHIDLRGPIRLGTKSPITGAVVVADPELVPLEGPFGRVDFLQVVGITAEELELCRAWRTDGVVDLLARDDARLVTALDRPSLLADPAVRAEVELRVATDGSALTELRIGTLRCRRQLGGGLTVQVGAGAAAALGPALRRELIGEGASFRVAGDADQMLVSVAREASWEADGDVLLLRIPLDKVGELAALFDGRTGWGRLPELEKLRFRVVP